MKLEYAVLVASDVKTGQFSGSVPELGIDGVEGDNLEEILEHVKTEIEKVIRPMSEIPKPVHRFVYQLPVSL